MGIITFLIYMCVFISLCVCAFERALGTIFAHIFIFCVNYVCVRGALGKHLSRTSEKVNTDRCDTTMTLISE